jgi:hypothetical protein
MKGKIMELFSISAKEGKLLCAVCGFISLDYHKFIGNNFNINFSS